MIAVTGFVSASVSLARTPGAVMLSGVSSLVMKASLLATGAVLHTACSSKAPMSVAPPNVRAKPAPRWSVTRESGLLPASIAELPHSNA